MTTENNFDEQLLKPRGKRKPPSGPPTHLQILARKQNWRKRILLGVLAHIKYLEMQVPYYPGPDPSCRTHLSLAADFIVNALSMIDETHRRERKVFKRDKTEETNSVPVYL